MSGRKAKKVLKNLRIHEVSLVDEGDNPGAEVVIMKRRAADPAALQGQFDALSELAGELADLAAGSEGDEGVAKAATILGGLNMDLDTLNTRLAEIETNLADVTKRAEEAEASLATVTKERDDARAELGTVTKERDDAVAKAKGGTDEDDVLKSLPEPVRKRLEDAERTAKEAQEAVAKAADQRELGEQVGKAKELGVANADEIGGLLHRIAKGKATAADADKVVEVLTVAKRVSEAGGDKLFEPVGKGKGGDADDPEAKLKAAAEAIQKAKPSLTYEAAYAEALDANPGLYDEVQKAKRRA